MFYISLAGLLFIVSVGIHVFFCRNASKQSLHVKPYIGIVIILGCIYLGVILIVQHLGLLDPRSLWGFPFKISAGLIYVLLAPVYLIFYTLTQQSSPSKRILLAILQRGTMSHEDILAAVNKEDVIMTRLNDLLASGCVVEKDGRYSLSRQGDGIAQILTLMQWMLGRDMGG